MRTAPPLTLPPAAKAGLRVSVAGAALRGAFPAWSTPGAPQPVAVTPPVAPPPVEVVARRGPRLRLDPDFSWELDLGARELPTGRWTAELGAGAHVFVWNHLGVTASLTGSGATTIPAIPGARLSSVDFLTGPRATLPAGFSVDVLGGVAHRVYRERKERVGDDWVPLAAIGGRWVIGNERLAIGPTARLLFDLRSTQVFLVSDADRTPLIEVDLARVSGNLGLTMQMGGRPQPIPRFRDRVSP